MSRCMMHEMFLLLFKRCLVHDLSEKTQLQVFTEGLT